MKQKTLITIVLLMACSPDLARAADVNNAEPLAGTKLLTMSGDIASNLVAGVDRFLLREIDKSVERRAKFWKRDFSSPEAYSKSIETNRQRLAHIIGVRDPRVRFDGFEIVTTNLDDGAIARSDSFRVFAVRWPVLGDVHGEGLLLVPTDGGSNRFKMDPALMKRYGLDPALMKRYGLSPPANTMTNTADADVIAIPDADQTPEQIVGLAEGVARESQFARRLAESGCRVLVPMLINRQMGDPKASHSNRGAGLSNREFLHRSAFEMGRTLMGYEVQKVLAAVDWFDRQRSAKNASATNSSASASRRKIGVVGWGEGGMIALYSAALDARIDVACVSGYFDDRRNIWQEPIDRNIFGLLEQFGDAELASMVAPRALIIEAAKGPELTLPGNGGGAPARLVTPKLDRSEGHFISKEFDRASALVRDLPRFSGFKIMITDNGANTFDGTGTFDGVPSTFLDALSPGAKLPGSSGKPLKDLRQNFDPKARLARQMHEIDRHNQWLLTESPYVRADFMKKVDTTSIEKYEKSAEPYRKFFYDEVIGRFDEKPLLPNVRSRKAYDMPKWTGYEVVMDVFPDVIAYGVLLLPKDLKPGEKRPVVVCQHGLEGRPQDVIAGDKAAYHDFAAKLAERGFITFAPQNLYIFTDRFRTLQRKANPLKKTLYSVITPQHQQMVDWLKTLPEVDPQRIAFYGLSYGGKTAMRVPALVTDYCLSICSADFNEWVWKNASTRSPYSYVWSGEYEIFEFDLGSTFNYSEMASLIAPRPFMVERGHFDGVAPDEAVGYEFGKVRFLYAAKLGIGDRCELESFVGPHTINGKGTYEFLHKHLKWPKGL